MSSSNLMPVVTRPWTIDEVPSHLSESFLKHVSDSHLDKLHDLPEDIQDVMGLQALRPSAVQSYDNSEQQLCQNSDTG